MRKFQVVIGGRGRKNMSALAWQICLIFIRTKLCIFSSNPLILNVYKGSTNHKWAESMGKPRSD